MTDPNSRKPSASRRDFLKTSTAAAAARPGRCCPNAHAAGSDTIKVGLIGCGGRGTRRGREHLRGRRRRPTTSSSTPWATCSRTTSRTAASSLENNGNVKDKFDVADDRCFVGFDAYQKVIDCGVPGDPGHPARLPPDAHRGRRQGRQAPLHREAGRRRRPRHPQGAGRRRGGQEEEPGRRRRHPAPAPGRLPREHEADPRRRHRRPHRRPGLLEPGRPLDEARASRAGRDMEWQLRNWYYFTWLCGDHIVEQHVHNLDVVNWAMGAHPVRAVGMGGRQVRTEPRLRPQLRPLRRRLRVPQRRPRHEHVPPDRRLREQRLRDDRRHQGRPGTATATASPATTRRPRPRARRSTPTSRSTSTCSRASAPASRSTS